VSELSIVFPPSVDKPTPTTAVRLVSSLVSRTAH
jgi:hypothetical protein